ncbi:hypothetical protein SANTM175S_02715 [Streptomyces antimycoticus]
MSAVVSAGGVPALSSFVLVRGLGRRCEALSPGTRRLGVGPYRRLHCRRSCSVPAGAECRPPSCRPFTTSCFASPLLGSRHGSSDAGGPPGRTGPLSAKPTKTTGLARLMSPYGCLPPHRALGGAKMGWHPAPPDRPTEDDQPCSVCRGGWLLPGRGPDPHNKDDDRPNDSQTQSAPTASQPHSSPSGRLPAAAPRMRRPGRHLRPPRRRPLQAVPHLPGLAPLHVRCPLRPRPGRCRPGRCCG